MSLGSFTFVWFIPEGLGAVEFIPVGLVVVGFIRVGLVHSCGPWGRWVHLGSFV